MEFSEEWLKIKFRGEKIFLPEGKLGVLVRGSVVEWLGAQLAADRAELMYRLGHLLAG